MFCVERFKDFASAIPINCLATKWQGKLLVATNIELLIDNGQSHGLHVFIAFSKAVAHFHFKFRVFLHISYSNLSQNNK